MADTSRVCTIVTVAVASSALTATLIAAYIGLKPTRRRAKSSHVKAESRSQRSSLDLSGFCLETTDTACCPSPYCGRRTDHYDPRPRSRYLSWADYFMAVAFLSAHRSKDPNKQVGACIVSQDQVILGIGYNGFPRGCHDSKLPWAKKSKDNNLLKTKYPYVCHAELNAVMNKNAASLEGARIYVTMFPCNECAKLLIQAGIVEVIYHEDKTTNPNNVPISGFGLDQAYEASRKLLTLAGVQLRKHDFEQPMTIHMS